MPAVEVHLSDVMAREAWRRVSVLGEHCIATVAGKGVDGYREALEALKSELGLVSDRYDALAAAVAERELDALLVSNLVNVRWLTGFNGSNAVAVVGAAQRRFVTDFRYLDAVRRAARSRMGARDRDRPAQARRRAACPAGRSSSASTTPT